MTYINHDSQRVQQQSSYHSSSNRSGRHGSFESRRFHGQARSSMFEGHHRPAMRNYMSNMANQQINNLQGQSSSQSPVNTTLNELQQLMQSLGGLSGFDVSNEGQSGSFSNPVNTDQLNELQLQQLLQSASSMLGLDSPEEGQSGSALNPIMGNFNDLQAQQLLQSLGGLLGSNDSSNNTSTNNMDLNQILQQLSGNPDDLDFNQLLGSLTQLLQQQSVPNISDEEFAVNEDGNESIVPDGELADRLNDTQNQFVQQQRDNLSQLGLTSEQVDELIPNNSELNLEVGNLDDLMSQIQTQEQSMTGFLQTIADMLGIPADEISQLLAQAQAQANNLMPVEPNNGIGDGALSLEDLLSNETNGNNNATTDGLNQILQQLSGNPDDVDLNQILGSLTQLLQQGQGNGFMMPVEPHDGIGDGAPSLSDLLGNEGNSGANNNDITDIQSLLQGFGEGEVGSLLQNITPEQLAGMLQQETGMSASVDEINQVLEQLGLSLSSDSTHDNSIADGEVVSSPTSVGTGDTDPVSEIQSLLQAFDMGEVSSLLEMISPEQLAGMLQQDSGLTVSADEIDQLLQQLGLNLNSNTTPMAVEPDNGIGDGAGSISIPDTIDNDSALADIQSLLQGFDMGEISSLLEMISPEELAGLLQQDSGLTVSADEVAQLLEQMGFGSTTTSTMLATDIVTDNVTPFVAENLPEQVNDPDTNIPDVAESVIGGDVGVVNQAEVNAILDEIQSLLQGINSDDLTSLFQMINPEDLAQMLGNEGEVVSATEISQLLEQLGLS